MDFIGFLAPSMPNASNYHCFIWKGSSQTHWKNGIPIFYPFSLTKKYLNFIFNFIILAFPFTFSAHWPKMSLFRCRPKRGRLYMRCIQNAVRYNSSSAAVNQREFKKVFQLFFNLSDLIFLGYGSKSRRNCHPSVPGIDWIAQNIGGHFHRAGLDLPIF